MYKIIPIAFVIALAVAVVYVKYSEYMNNDQCQDDSCYIDTYPHPSYPEDYITYDYNGEPRVFYNSTPWTDWKSVSFRKYKGSYYIECEQGNDWSVSVDSNQNNSVYLKEIDVFNCDYGIYKCFDVDKTKSTKITLDYRAASNTADSAVTNAHLNIYPDCVVPNYSEKEIHNIILALGGTTDTEWIHYEKELDLEYDRITVFVFTKDGWIANWKKENWFNNIQISN